MVTDAELMEGAESFELGDGATGVLLVHGFTSTPQSMRLWGESLAEHGFSVACPLLPGHGTRWQDLNEVAWTDWIETAQDALDALAGRCDQVFVAGLSMGGTISLYLAAENQDAVAGVATVGASLYTHDPRLIALPILKHVVPSLPGISNDVADPDHRELAYDRVPLKALAQFLEMQGEARKRLPRVKVPAELFQSRQDHVVDTGNMPFIASKLGSETVSMTWLDRSYHVATLDYDRETIFSKSAAFFRKVAEDHGD